MEDDRFLKRYRIIVAVIAAALLALVYRAVSSWGDRPTVLVLGLGLVVALLLLLDWVFDVVGPPVWRLVTSLAHSLGAAFARDPEVSRIAERHPRLAGWLRRRWTLERWTGRYLTLMVVLTAWFLLGFVTIARDLAATSSLVAYDPQVSALVRAYRTPGATRFLWIATVTGDTRVEVVLSVVLVGLLLMWGRRAEAVLAAVTLAVGSAFGSFVKIVAGRTRPPVEFMLIRAPLSRSFPSGHALGSFLFYGIIAFVLLRSPRRTARQRPGILMVCAAAVFLVGLSRVYLGVHWPTDVLASWCLGAAWLTVTVGTFLSWERYGSHGPRAEPAFTPQVRAAVTLVVVASAIGAVVIGAQADPLLQRAAAGPPPRPYSSSQGVAWRRALPRFTEKLDGTPQEPVSLVFVGTRDQLVGAFAAAGWRLADPPSLVGVIKTAIAAAENRPDPTAVMTPSFIAGEANDLGFEKEQGAASARRRHHARFWLTGVTLDGKPVWVGTASFDAGLEIGKALPFPTHRIDANIDRERDVVAAGLAGTGRVKDLGEWRVTPPEAGTNAAGDRFFTDGTARVLEVR